MARRSKDNRRIEEKKKKRRKRLERKREHGFVGSDSLSYGLPGVEKMSEVLDEFVEPYLDQTKNIDEMRTLLTLGILAWNTAILPEDKQDDEVESYLQKLCPEPGGARDEMRGFIKSLIDRKKTSFSSNQRMIVSFELSDTGSGYQLNVASTLVLPAAK